MKTRVARIFLMLALFGTGLFAVTSCERYKTKKDIRERRVDYYQHYLDSVRTHNDMLKDSLRKEWIKQREAQSAGQEQK